MTVAIGNSTLQTGPSSRCEGVVCVWGPRLCEHPFVSFPSKHSDNSPDGGPLFRACETQNFRRKGPFFRFGQVCESVSFNVVAESKSGGMNGAEVPLTGASDVSVSVCETMGSGRQAFELVAQRSCRSQLKLAGDALFYHFILLTPVFFLLWMFAFIFSTFKAHKVELLLVSGSQSINRFLCCDRLPSSCSRVLPLALDFYWV